MWGIQIILRQSIANMKNILHEIDIKRPPSFEGWSNLEKWIVL